MVWCWRWGRRRRVAVVALVAGLLGGAERELAAERVAVRAVRVWPLGEVTRVAVEASGPFEFKYQQLAEPSRLYVDILNAVNRVAPGRVVHEIPVNDGVVERIRVGQNRAEVVRVVLYLATECEFSLTRLANPERLVIEVRAKRQGWPLSKLEKLPPLGQAKSPEAGRGSETAAREASREPALTGGSAGKGREETPGAAGPAGAAQPAPAKELASTPAARAGSPKPSEPAATARLEKRLPDEARRSETPELPGPPAEVVPRPAQRNEDGKRSMTRVLGLKVRKVVIDPGHGGKDTGTIGPTGLMEKDVTLDVARRLAQLIEERLGATAILTRTDDEFVALEDRTRIANEAGADLFVSLHVNSSRYRSVGGIETFYLSLTDSQADLEVAARENAGATRSIHELTELIRKIALDDKVQESRDFALAVQREVYSLVRQVHGRARDRGVKKAPFVVLIGAQMPSILVELGFITNPQEERLLADPGHRQRMAEAVYRGIERYTRSLSHFQLASGEDGGQ